MSNPFPHSIAVTAMAAANAAAINAIGSSSSSSSPSSSLLLAEQANNLRLMAVYDRISLYINGGTRFEPSDVIRLCYSLVKAIDCSLTLNDIPGIAHRLPPLVKKVYEWRKNDALQSAIMMLLISIKNACRRGWFRTIDSEELLYMADEMCSKFCTELCPNTHVSHASDTISKIMLRFYPGLMLCSLVIAFEAKLGYDVMMSDFHFSKNQPSEQKIVLIVVKTENLETSSCIAGPLQVSFLINGKGVEKRNNVSLDQGPQFPTDISRMLKYGINVLQTIGFFDGTYLIAVAYVSKIFTSSPPALKDYVQPVVAALDSDSEIMEGPSRIQLSCPISFKRIKTPVKGHLCKHHQCFDYDNYLEMNSRKPNWRCAHCNQPVCITDLRIDRNMVKILEEAREDVAEVVIHADGSWNVVAEQGTCTDHDVTQVHQTHNMDCETNISKASMTDPVDLTMEEDDICDVTEKIRQDVSMDSYGSQSGNLMLDTEDRKPFIDVGGIQVPNFLGSPQLLNHNSNSAQVAGYHAGNIMHPSFMASYATNGFPQMSNMIGSLGFSDTVSPFDQTQFSVHGLPIMRCETDRMAGRIIPSHVDRIPIAVQALPVPSHTHGTSRRVHANVSPRQYLAVNPSTTTLENFNGGNGSMDMQQITRTTADTSGIQDISQQNPHYVLNEGSLQHMVGLPSTNTLNSRQLSGHRRSPSDLDSYRASAQHSPFSRHSLQTPPPGFRAHHSIGQPSSLALSSAIRQASFSHPSANFGSHRSQPQSPLPPHLMRSPATSPANSLPARDNARVLGTERWKSMTGGGAPSPLSRSGNLPEHSAEPSWRPTGRMRGSLSGSDYSAVISNYMAPLSQPATSGRTPTPSPAPSTSDQVSALVANNLLAHGANFTQDD